MKLMSSSASAVRPPSPFALANFGGAPTNKRHIYLSVYCLLIAALWNTHNALAAPAKLGLQVPVFEASAASQTNGENNTTTTTIDSYGNPIESLQPIETPDGRKVVSAQGLQFEIPTYASGITEIKKPSDDLLPPFVDKFGNDAKTKEDTTTPNKARNPFLPSVSFNDGKYRPQNHPGRQNTATTTTRRPTTTTTTTTIRTTAPTAVEKNPFQPTIPPYLRDFDYQDLGPAVPFVYDPNEDEDSVDILPPSQIIEDSNKPDSASSPAFNPSSSSSPSLNSQTPQGFTNKFSTSATSLSSSSSIPSIVTAPLPSTQTNQNEDGLSTATQPPVVFVPPPPTPAESITPTFNKHFAASLEPASTSSATSSSTTEKKVSLSADRESFPPFNNVITGSSTLPSKTTFTKSGDGKVITNNVFLGGGLSSPATPVKPSAFSTSASSQDKYTSGGSSFQSFSKTTTSSSVIGTTSALASGFVTNAGDASTTYGSKYTGRFGGPSGVLAPQRNSGLTTTSTIATSSFNKPTVSAQRTGSSTANHKFTGSFGGPPGVLKPYDNVKSG